MSFDPETNTMFISCRLGCHIHGDDTVHHRMECCSLCGKKYLYKDGRVDIVALRQALPERYQKVRIAVRPSTMKPFSDNYDISRFEVFEAIGENHVNQDQAVQGRAPQGPAPAGTPAGNEREAAWKRQERLAADMRAAAERILQEQMRNFQDGAPKGFRGYDG